MYHIRFIQLFAVAIYDAVPKVDAITRNAHDPFHDVQSRFRGREEHHNVPVAYFTIREKRPDPMRPGRKLHPVDENVIADQQRVFH